MKKRRLALTLAAALLLAAAGSPFWAPPLLRGMDWFAAERVEVSGTRLLAPHEALAASGVKIGANVWTDPAAWEAALRRHPAVADAEVTRRLPSTLRIRVREKRPAALVEAGTLRPATADGEVLPVDPARVRIDLPLLRAAVGGGERTRKVADERTRAALAETGRLGELDPALMARVSEVRPAADGGLKLTLTSPAADVLIPSAVDAASLARLRAALEHLEPRLAADTLGRRAVVDLRYDEQVVVRKS